MASGRNGTLYTGMTANLLARAWKHRNGTFDGFSKSHGCTNLVWFEQHAWVVEAIRRENHIKGWKRDWKLQLIEASNPDWLDLSADWYLETDPDWTPPEEPD